MNIVRAMTPSITGRAEMAASVLWAAGVSLCGAAAAHEGAVGDGAALPVIEWSLQPPMSNDRRSAELTRDARLHQPGAPALTDPVAPTVRLRHSGTGDALRLPVASPQDLPADRGRLVVSLRATPLSRTSMVFEQAASARTANSWLALQPAVPPTTRVGLELRSASTETRLGFNNVLKMQLSGGSTLLLKPRRSGVAVTWRSEF